MSGDGASEDILRWCASVVGSCEVESGDARFHGRTTVCRLRTATGHAYVKVHRDRGTWGPEVHGYERWSRAFPGRTPTLLGVYDAGPFALLVSGMPGKNLEDAALPEAKRRDAWRAAGNALTSLHELEVGEYFGSCDRDGHALGVPVTDAVEYIAAAYEEDIGRGARGGWLSEQELAVIERARVMIPAFAGERPIPCHRDYCPVNWIVDDDGEWIGVIDYEFSRWDVRVSDFSRYPDWDWMLRPDLTDAFFEGYGRPLSPVEQDQLLVSRTQYALGAIVWGRENSFFGFEQEGRDALVVLAELLP
ncbi:aminoglycoside phosphotransferase family protein [Candidatus Poribacteria bacterium]|nr:aminoglycoside phosphotransferase family protein [Candidatus Poribacteria bacterium]MBT5710593.1 aminoglycoside phosphotransferase family protein [Candidatus Poribacteria bacterium]MBT7806228.1 aminoglycoside phosphotransferase family protein [Candidatus Poribacteria bacterium]